MLKFYSSFSIVFFNRVSHYEKVVINTGLDVLTTIIDQCYNTGKPNLLLIPLVCNNTEIIIPGGTIYTIILKVQRSSLKTNQRQ
jgi:hypothetical protein